jgi:Zn-dependent protease
MNVQNYFDKLKKYFWFSNAELRSYALTVLILGFVLSFNNWGDTTFDLKTGLINLLKGILFVAIALFIHHAGQRLWGIKNGFRVEQKLWWYGILISLILAIVSNGRVAFLAVSSTSIYMLPQHRLGKFRYGTNMRDLANICLAGPLFNVFLASFLVILSWIHIFPAELAMQLFTFNLVFAAWNLLPIPPLDGSRVMYYSRLAYVFFASTIGSYAIMAYLFNFYSYIYAIIIGLIVFFIFLVTVERKL